MTNKRRLLIAFVSVAVLLAVAWADTSWRGVPTVQNSQGFTAAAEKARNPGWKYYGARGWSPWPFVVKVQSYHSNEEGDGFLEDATFVWWFGCVAEGSRQPDLVPQPG